MGGEAARVRVEGGARCPFCHDGLEKTAELVACAPCGARFHQACHVANEARCPACGATEVLVPPRPTRARRAPPSGSKLRLREEGRGTVVSWDPRTSTDWVIVALCFLGVLTSPIGLWILWGRHKQRELELVLGEDELELEASTAFGSKRVRLRREELGAVRVESAGLGGEQYRISVDAGLVRHKLAVGITDTPLAPAELEWLAERIRSWGQEG